MNRKLLYNWLHTLNPNFLSQCGHFWRPSGERAGEWLLFGDCLRPLRDPPLLPLLLKECLSYRILDQCGIKEMSMFFLFVTWSTNLDKIGVLLMLPASLPPSLLPTLTLKTALLGLLWTFWHTAACLEMAVWEKVLRQTGQGTRGSMAAPLSWGSRWGRVTKSIVMVH